MSFKFYTGSLQTHRRASLLEIIHALGLETSLPPGYVHKHDLIHLIREQLKANVGARLDPRYADLWAHMPESKQEDLPERNRLLSRGSDTPMYREERTPPASGSSPGSPRVPAPAPAAAETPSTLREAILHPHILDTLLQSAPHPSVDDLALVPASRSLRRKASRSLSLVARQSTDNLRAAARGSAGVVAGAQERLSHPWVVAVALVAAELSWIAYEALPWVEKSFGPSPSFLLPSVPRTTVSLPSLRLFLHPAYLLALSRWALSTLVFPLLLATLISFPRTSSSSPRTRARAASRNAPAPPSALIFCLSRLAVALLRGYIFPRSSSSLPLAHPHQHSTLQTLRHILLEATVTGGPGSTGMGSSALAQTWTFQGAVEGLWGVVAVGMAAGTVVAAVEELRRR
ncbi:hypothetical protein JCM1841_001323 [Sporobolomyces salmonicolor]